MQNSPCFPLTCVPWGAWYANRSLPPALRPCEHASSPVNNANPPAINLPIQREYDPLPVANQGLRSRPFLIGFQPRPAPIWTIFSCRRPPPFWDPDFPLSAPRDRGTGPKSHCLALSDLGVDGAIRECAWPAKGMHKPLKFPRAPAVFRMVGTIPRPGVAPPPIYCFG